MVFDQFLSPRFVADLPDEFHQKNCMHADFGYLTDVGGIQLHFGIGGGLRALLCHTRKTGAGFKMDPGIIWQPCATDA
jgi:hypothetical protein